MNPCYTLGGLLVNRWWILGGPLADRPLVALGVPLVSPCCTLDGPLVTSSWTLGEPISDACDQSHIPTNRKGNLCFNYELCLVIIATCHTLRRKTGFPLQRAESFLPFQEATTSSHRGIILQAWKRGFSQSLRGIIFSITKYILFISIEPGSKIYPAAPKQP